MSYSIEDVKKTLLLCANQVSLKKEELERIDSESGDGDLGSSMAKASDAIIHTVSEYPDGEKDIGKLIYKCAMAVNGAAPSTMGTLISAGLMQVGKLFLARESIDIADIYHIPGTFAKAIMQRGKATEGDRTVLDALLPLSRVFENAEVQSVPPSVVINEAAAAAQEGMERTKTMVPRIGRAKWMPDNAVGHPDGGAYLCCIVINSLKN